MTMKRKPDRLSNPFLDGQLLVVMPLMRDKRFARSVIYMCVHNDEGAMGLIINQRASHIDFPDLLDRLGIKTGDGGQDAAPSQAVHVGGPVETGRGFVLHSSDYLVSDQTLQIDAGVCLTATMDILKAIAEGSGPCRSILALGYASWAPGQLENEIAANGWLNCPADPDLVFAVDLDQKYARAMERIGIDLSHLVSDVGHA